MQSILHRDYRSIGEVQDKMIHSLSCSDKLNLRFPNWLKRSFHFTLMYSMLNMGVEILSFHIPNIKFSHSYLARVLNYLHVNLQ